MKSKTTRLKEHHERLIFLNSVNHYTQSGNPKIDKYYKLLKAIKTQTIIQRNLFFNPIINPLKQLKQC
jgi:hypothetical protein